MIIYIFGSVVLAIDCVVCRTVNQLFTCVLVTCVSTWCGVTVNVRVVLKLTGPKKTKYTF